MLPMGVDPYANPIALSSNCVCQSVSKRLHLAAHLSLKIAAACGRNAFGYLQVGMPFSALSVSLRQDSIGRATEMLGTRKLNDCVSIAATRVATPLVATAARRWKMTTSRLSDPPSGDGGHGKSHRHQALENYDIAASAIHHLAMVATGRAAAR